MGARRKSLVLLGGVPSCRECEFSEPTPLDADLPEVCFHPSVQDNDDGAWLLDEEGRFRDPRPAWCPISPKAGS